MTDNNKTAPEKTESGSETDPLAQQAEVTPTAPIAPSAMAEPEEPNRPTVKG
ncbi:hypothetical protein [Pseudoduganella umbonata]|uniref:Uncharacterized protein n=1 Tax=Pseudoduganella umbonata TaxID=864828 RepID=A0A7W5E9Y8_9BURK|nr:hypothetical protein [Pseudoduganella umbonata]MBB3221374.1 hypothetical protein [Pseudoduganella umbonata]